MRKLLISLLAIGATSAFADVSGFQQFDNQYSLGYGMNQMSTGSNNNGGMLVGNQYINLEIEKLFDNGMWMDVNANLVTSVTNYGLVSTNANQAANYYSNYSGATSANGNFGGLNAKVGYAMQLHDALQVIPYLQAGRNTNLSGYALASTTGDSAVGNATNVTNDFYYTLGGGARIEWRAMDNLSMYFDQAAVYNFDQTPYNAGFNPQNTFQARSTLGVKYNVMKNLQIGAQGYFDAYNKGNSAGTGPDFSTAQSVQMPMSNIGGLVSVGLTY